MVLYGPAQHDVVLAFFLPNLPAVHAKQVGIDEVLLLTDLRSSDREKEGEKVEFLPPKFSGLPPGSCRDSDLYRNYPINKIKPSLRTESQFIVLREI